MYFSMLKLQEGYQTPLNISITQGPNNNDMFEETRAVISHSKLREIFSTISRLIKRRELLAATFLNRPTFQESDKTQTRYPDSWRKFHSSTVTCRRLKVSSVLIKEDADNNYL